MTQSEELQAVLQPYILRRHKTDVMKKVPPKEEVLMEWYGVWWTLTLQVVIEVEFTRLQKKIYRSIYEKNVLQLANNQVGWSGLGSMVTGLFAGH